MPDPINPKEAAFDAGTKAIVTATEAAAAQEEARRLDTAALLSRVDEHLKQYTITNAEVMTESIKTIVSDALGRVKSRYVDTDRIPLLCQTIFAMQEKIEDTNFTMKDAIKELKDLLKENKEASEKQHDNFVTKTGEYWIVRTIVFTGVSVTLITVFTLILSSVLKK